MRKRGSGKHSSKPKKKAYANTSTISEKDESDQNNMFSKESMDSFINGLEPLFAASAKRETEISENLETDVNEPHSEISKSHFAVDDNFVVLVNTLIGSVVRLSVCSLDGILELKQLLSDTAELSYITNFELRFEDKKLDDFSEVKDIGNIQDQSTISMHFVPYDYASSRTHVMRLKDLLEARLDELFLNPASVVNSSKSQDHNFPNFLLKKSGEKSEFEEALHGCDCDFSSYKQLVEQLSDVMFPSSANKQQHSTPSLSPHQNGGGGNGGGVKHNGSNAGVKSSNSNIQNQQQMKTSYDSLSVFNPDYFSLKSMETVNEAESGAMPHLLKSFCYSSWNPPPASRKLSGDLFYLEIETLEEKKYFVTAAPQGFYLNNSTEDVFDPLPPKTSYSSKTLVGLLCHISKSFQQSFPKILQLRCLKHPFETSQVPYPKRNRWLLYPEEHRPDRYRAEEFFLLQSGFDPRHQFREWNEEFQSSKELPCGSIDERIIRDRTLFKVHCDFVEAATSGVRAIIDKTVSPLNPMDAMASHVFLINNLFFSYAVDGRAEAVKKFGDPFACAAANHDLHGVTSFNEADIRGIHTVLTAVIDYKGTRLIVQSPIPGILLGEQHSKHLYGTMDDGKTYVFNEKYHALLKEVGTKLFFKEHSVLDKDGKPALLCGPGEIKGIMGSDGRFYVLDLMHSTPRDANYPTLKTALIRPEMVKIYTRTKYFEFLTQMKKSPDSNVSAATPNADTSSGTTTTNATSIDTNNVVANSNSTATTTATPISTGDTGIATAPPPPSTDKEDTSDKKKKIEEIVDSIDDVVKVKKGEQNAADAAVEDNGFSNKKPTTTNVLFTPTYFNTSVFTDHVLAGTPEEIQKDEEAVKLLGSFVVNEAIPSYLHELNMLDLCPLDGLSLTGQMHERGLNMRYLGKIASGIVESKPYLKLLCEQEMFLRTAKWEFNEMLRNAPNEKTLPGIEKFLNSLFSPFTTQSTQQQQQQQSQENEHLNSLLKKILTAMEKKFSYTLKESLLAELFNNKYSMLRSFCLKVGLRVGCRDINWNSPTPFNHGDIFSIEPVVKYAPPRSNTAVQFFDVGKQQLMTGFFEKAFENCTKAMMMLQQIQGPMSREVAACFNYLSSIMANFGDNQQALVNVHKAILITRRVEDPDSAFLCSLHQFAGMLCYRLGQHACALRHFLRARYIFQLVSASPQLHVEYITVLSHIALFYQELGDSQRCLKYQLLMADISEKLFGLDSLQSGPIYHSIAVTYNLMALYRKALDYEKKYFKILSKNYGDENNVYVKESSQWLEIFLKNALKAQKEENERKKILMNGTTTATTTTADDSANNKNNSSSTTAATSSSTNTNSNATASEIHKKSVSSNNNKQKKKK